MLVDCRISWSNQCEMPFIYFDSTQSYVPQGERDSQKNVLCASKYFCELTGECAQYALMTQLFNYTNALLIKVGFSSLFFSSLKVFIDNAL